MKASEVVHARVQQLQRDQPERYKNYTEPFKAVLAADPALARAYREEQGADADDAPMIDIQGPSMQLDKAPGNVLRGVEIFARGEWNGDLYTEQDLDDMVKASKEIDFRAALKLGHTSDKPGKPAYGYVENVRRKGDKLIADLTNVHDEVFKAIKQRMFDRVSAEVFFNLRRGGKVFRRALRAVALLGAEVPAVAGLKPLHETEFAVGEFDAARAYERAFGTDDALPSAEVDRRAREYMRQRDERSYTVAMDAVLARDPALHVAYMEEQAGELPAAAEPEAVLLGKHRRQA